GSSMGACDRSRTVGPRWLCFVDGHLAGADSLKPQGRPKCGKSDPPQLLTKNEAAIAIKPRTAKASTTGSRMTPRRLAPSASLFFVALFFDLLITFAVFSAVRQRRSISDPAKAITGSSESSLGSSFRYRERPRPRPPCVPSGRGFRAKRAR